MIESPSTLSDQILNLAEGIGTSMAALKAAKADKATTLSGYGITDAYTKTQIDTDKIGTLTVAAGAASTVANAIAKAKSDLQTEIGNAVGSVYTVKGTKANYAALPSSGNTKGDVWNVTAANGNTPAGTNYVWTGTEWDALGGTIDMSGYLEKSGGTMTGTLTLSATESVTDDSNKAASTGYVKDCVPVSVGSATQGVYTNASGVVTAMTYTLAKSVPADAVFTDTTYSDFGASGANAAAGLVPSPGSTAGTTKFLCEDATWKQLTAAMIAPMSTDPLTTFQNAYEPTEP